MSRATTKSRPDPLVVAQIVGAMKQEILHDMANGIVDRKARSFSKLHDFVDANLYAEKVFVDLGLTDGDPHVVLFNIASDAINAWLRSGAAAKALRRWERII